MQNPEHIIFDGFLIAPQCSGILIVCAQILLPTWENPTVWSRTGIKRKYDPLFATFKKR